MTMCGTEFILGHDLCESVPTILYCVVYFISYSFKIT